MKRIVFSFDDKSLESLSKMTAQGRVPPSAKVPTYSGPYKEIEITNPQTNESRVIVVPAGDCADCVTAARSNKWDCPTCYREWS